MKTLFLSLCFLSLIAACGPSPEQRAEMTATAMTATASAWTSTPTATNTATSTPTLKPTDTPTATPSPTPTDTHTSTPTPTPTHDPGRFYASDDSFSLVYPTGWREEDVGMEYPALIAGMMGENKPNIIFYTDTSSFPVEWYAAGVQDSLAERLDNLSTISEDFLITSSGKNYFRWAMNFYQNGVSVHAVQYFFENGDWKLIIAYSRLKDQGVENDALVEAAIDTVQFGP
jgi:hypothetical protein